MNDHAPILLLGGSGMLGRAFRHALDGRPEGYEAPSHAQADLLDGSAAGAVVRLRPPMVINCAAWTDVDGAEADEAGARALNGEAVGRLARACAEHDALLVHFSTDYVFDGAGEKPYAIDHPRAPLNAYGRSKAAGEEAIEASGAPHLIVRTSWLYAPWGKNFVRTMARLCQQRDSLAVVDDQRGRPTSCEHLAGATLGLADAGVRGIAHVTDGGECTWYGFTCEINRLLDASCAVSPCTSEEFPRPAPRPAYSVLDLSRSEAVLGPMPDWKQNLGSVVRRLEGMEE